MRAMCVAGARPNFVKVKPLLAALERRRIDVVFVHTGQHYDDRLDRAMFEDLGLRRADHELRIGSGSHAEQVAAVMTGLEPIVMATAPDVLLVVGDVNSTLGAALVGAKSSSTLAHIEAGLRSGDRSMPEEINRIIVDRISDLLFAPSADAVENLRREGVEEASIALVGNVMADSLHALLPVARARRAAAGLALAPGSYVLATLHRPASVDSPAVLSGLVRALTEIDAELPVVLAAHPRTRKAMCEIGLADAVRTLPPLGYIDFLSLEADAAAVVTDSGGVQEETTILGVPCVTVRTSTERPITVSQGTNEVVGLDPDAVVAGFRRALGRRGTGVVPPLWEGGAAERIVDVLIGA